MPFLTEKITRNGNTGVLNLRFPNTRKKLRFSLRFNKPTARKLMHVTAKEYRNTVGMLGLEDFSLFVFKLCILFSMHLDVLIVFCELSVVMQVESGFGGLGVACWPLVPKFTGSNLPEAVGFLRAKKSSARLPSEGK